MSERWEEQAQGVNPEGAETAKDGARDGPAPAGMEGAGTEAVPEPLRLAAHLEALLFGSGEPVPRAKLAQWLGLDETALHVLVQTLHAAWAGEGRPLEVREVGGGLQLVLAPSWADRVRPHVATRPERLSPALLETLAIVAYRQPIRSAAIDAARGVRAERALAVLEDRGLIEGHGQTGYRTTQRFLVAFGLNSLEDLPPWPGAAGPGDLGGQDGEETEAGPEAMEGEGNAADAGAAWDPEGTPRDPSPVKT